MVFLGRDSKNFHCEFKDWQAKKKKNNWTIWSDRKKKKMDGEEKKIDMKVQKSASL